jgi:hypothetical protein
MATAATDDVSKAHSSRISLPLLWPYDGVVLLNYLQPESGRSRMSALGHKRLPVENDSVPPRYKHASR